MADPERPDDDPDSDEAILQRLRDEYDYDLANWEKIREEGNKDVRYCAGDTWEKEDRAARAGRPVLNLDQLSQYLNQLENTVRQNKRAIKASPAGNGATDKTAELRSNRIREIEYESHAQEAYIQAFANCAMRSYGFGRIVAEYEDDQSTTQVLRIKAIANPNQVIPDSDAESTSGRDWKRLFFVHTVSDREFARDYPDAEIKSFTPEHQQAAPRWIKDKRIQIAEYWMVTETPSTKGGRPTRDVCQYLTNGLELLAKAGQPKKTVWKGELHTPFFACYGKILYVENAIGDVEKLMLSYVRLARDAAKLYNWVKSTEGEVLNMPAKAPYFAYEGQLSPENITALAESIHAPVPVIFAKATSPATGPDILPLPRRELYDPPVQSFEIAAESARRDVQNALGRYSVSDQRLGNQRVMSGTALRELDKSGDLGSYHFIDHYDDMIMFCGEQLDDLMPAYDDQPKEVAVRLPDGKAKMERINTPTQRAPDGTLTFGPDDLRMDVGRHTITISTGPSFDSQREVAKDASLNLLNNPQLAPIVAPRAIRLLDLGPEGEAMADDLEAAQPPAVQVARAARQQQDGKPDPVRQQLQIRQLQEQVQRAEQIMEAQRQEIETKQAEQDGKLKIEALKADSEADLQLALKVMDNAKAIAVAHIGAASKGADIDAHAAEEAQALGLQAANAEAEREHALQMLALQQALQAEQQAEQRAAQGPPVVPRPKKTIIRKRIERSPEGAIVGGTEEREEVDAEAP